MLNLSLNLSNKLTTFTDRPLLYIDRFIWVPNNHPHNTIVAIFYILKPTTSIIGQF